MRGLIPQIPFTTGHEHYHIMKSTVPSHETSCSPVPFPGARENPRISGRFYRRLAQLILTTFGAFLICGCNEHPAGADTKAPPKAQAIQPEAGKPQAEGFPKYGDVMMRGLKVLRSPDGTGPDTLAAAKAFGVNRIEWIFDVDDAFINEAKKEGISISPGLSPNLYREVVKDIPDGVAKFMCRDLGGNLVVYPHFRLFKNFETDFYVPDVADEEFTRLYIDYVCGMVEKGVLSAHRDDWAPNFGVIRMGGSFGPASIAYFREYLRKKYNADELKRLGVDDINTFDVRQHFLALGAPVGPGFDTWRDSPLVEDYVRAMRQAVLDHWTKVRKEVAARTGKNLVLAGHVLEWDDLGTAFDYGIAELPSHFEQPPTIYHFARETYRAGKRQAYLPGVDAKWQEKPDFVQRTRRVIALCYAYGTLAVVPWDQFMSPRGARYFGKPEEYADLFWLVRKNRQFFDNHEEAFVTGWDSSSGLYQWAPTQLLGPEPASPLPPVRLNSRTMLASVRKVPGVDGKATIHLVDWAMGPRPSEVTIDPLTCVGSEWATITLLQPGKDPVPLGMYSGGTIGLPALNPWAILRVEAAGSPPDAAPPSPRISGAPRGLIGRGQSIELIGAPGTGIVYQLGEAGEAWKPYTGPVPINKACTLSAKSVRKADGKESAPVRVSIQVFDDFRSTTDLAGMKSTSLLPLFNQEQGLAPVEQIHADSKDTVKGLPVNEGLRVKGNSRLTCPVDPAWKVFRAEFGIDDKARIRPSMKFQVFFDGKLAFESPIINPIKNEIQDAYRIRGSVQLNIPEGTKSITLATKNNAFSEDQSIGIWIDPSAYAK